MKLATMISLLLGLSIAKAEFKMAFVDTQKAIQESKIGKKAKAEIEKDGEKKKKELDKKKADLDKMREDLEKKRTVLSEEAFGKKAQELKEEMFKFNELVNKSQNELQKKENDLLAPIADKMKKAIEKLAKDKGFSMVIQTNPIQQNVIYGADDVNLTSSVITEIDK
jgi:outer membrane protein